jgi:glycosyltransferase involved in cell wall biosynthesis
MNVLYLSYNGALEPLGINQIVIYPEILTQAGHRFTFLTFEKPHDVRDRQRVELLHQRLKHKGIDWIHTAYHKTPSLLGTLWDVLRGASIVRRQLKQQKFDLIHVRSYLPLLMCLLQKRRTSPILFDMRGFWADERVDWGSCAPGSRQYRWIKRLERWGLEHADMAIVLSERARTHLLQSDVVKQRPIPIETVVCYVDTGRFAPDAAVRERERRRLGWGQQRIMVHSGSLGGLHMVEEIVQCFVAGRRMDPSLRLLVLSQSDPRGLIAALEAAGARPDEWAIESHIPEQVPQVLTCGDLGLALIKPTFSKIASWPTKLGEYLALGMPVLTTPKIGDTDSFIRLHGVGAVMPELTPAGCAVGMAEMLNLLNHTPRLREHCREVAVRWLDIEGMGYQRYRSIYARLESQEKAAL